MGKEEVHRSSETGRFIDEATAEANPATTETESTAPSEDEVLGRVLRRFIQRTLHNYVGIDISEVVILDGQVPVTKEEQALLLKVQARS